MAYKLKWNNDDNVVVEYAVKDSNGNNIVSTYVSKGDASSFLEEVSYVDGVLTLQNPFSLASNSTRTQSLGTTTSSSNKFVFDNITNSYNGIMLFTYNNIMIMLPVYSLTVGTTYKTTGIVLYNNSNNYVSTIINYKITSEDKLEIWSGDSNYSITNGLTGNLYLI